MSPHHSDQMSQRSQVSRVALCMSKVKVLWVSECVTRSPIELFWTAKNSKFPFSNNNNSCVQIAICLMAASETLFWMCIGFLIICIFVCLFEFVVRLSKLLPSLLFEFPPSSRLARSISWIQIEDSKNSFSSLKVYSAHMARAMKTYILMRWQQKMYHPHKHSTPHAHRCIRVLCKNAGW